MNNLIGIKVSLEIHEPWEKSDVLIGTVSQMVLYESKIHLFIQVDGKRGIFIISERYAEEKIDEISADKKIHVAIGFYNDSKNAQLADNRIIDKSIYYGIGSICLV